MELNMKKKLDFLGYTYEPLKRSLDQALKKIAAKEKQATGTEFSYHVPTKFYENYGYKSNWTVKSIEDLPDVIASIGFSEFFSKEFREKIIEEGNFQCIPCSKINKDFINTKIEDPKKCYNIYSVIPYVMLIDRRNLSNLPVPRSWEDLMNPIYKDNITIGDSVYDINEIVLLHIYKNYGEEGLAKLAHNIKDAYDASNMIRNAVNSNKVGSAIYIMPWYDAKTCTKYEHLEIVWPIEGALISPLYFMIKSSKIDKMKRITRFITGACYGNRLAENCFPVLNGKVDNKLPRNAFLNWIGWDFIYSRNINETMEYVEEVFRDCWENNYMDKLMVL